MAVTAQGRGAARTSRRGVVSFGRGHHVTLRVMGRQRRPDVARAGGDGHHFLLHKSRFPVGVPQGGSLCRSTVSPHGLSNPSTRDPQYGVATGLGVGAVQAVFKPRGRRCVRIWSMTDGCVMNATMREPPNATVKRRRRGGCPLLMRRSTGWTGRRSTPSPATSGAASTTRTSGRSATRSSDVGGCWRVRRGRKCVMPSSASVVVTSRNDA